MSTGFGDTRISFGDVRSTFGGAISFSLSLTDTTIPTDVCHELYIPTGGPPYAYGLTLQENLNLSETITKHVEITISSDFANLDDVLKLPGKKLKENMYLSDTLKIEKRREWIKETPGPETWTNQPTIIDP